MTYTELVAAITDHLGLTSTTADTRVGLELNRYYRALTADLGLSTSRRAVGVVGAPVAPEPTVTVDFDMVKITTVYIPAADANETDVVLDEIPFSVMRLEQLIDGDPTKFAIQSMDSSTVTIRLNAAVDEDYAIEADGLVNGSNLSGSDEPTFPADFHQVLVEGVLERELRKMEKLDLAREARAERMRLESALRMFIAKSNFMRLRQNEYPREGRLRPWME